MLVNNCSEPTPPCHKLGFCECIHLPWLIFNMYNTLGTFSFGGALYDNILEGLQAQELVVRIAEILIEQGLAFQTENIE